LCIVSESFLASSDTTKESSCNTDVPHSLVGDNVDAYINLKTISKEMKSACGNVCLTNDGGVKGKYYNAIWKDFQCHDLFSHDIFDR
jgi:hypothetical protein